MGFYGDSGDTAAKRGVARVGGRSNPPVLLRSMVAGRAAWGHWPHDVATNPARQATNAWRRGTAAASTRQVACATVACDREVACAAAASRQQAAVGAQGIAKATAVASGATIASAMAIAAADAVANTVAVAVAAAPQWQAARGRTRLTAPSSPASRPHPRFLLPSPFCSGARTRREWRARPSPHRWWMLPRSWPANWLAKSCADSPADPKPTVRWCQAPCGIPLNGTHGARVLGGETADGGASLSSIPPRAVPSPWDGRRWSGRPGSPRGKPNVSSCAGSMTTRWSSGASVHVGREDLDRATKFCCTYPLRALERPRSGGSPVR